MTWIHEENIPKKITFQSEATTGVEVARDVEIVINRCIDNKIEDGADSADSILLIENATNGYIEIFFGSPDDMEYIGQSQYFLQLPKLYELSLTHENGSFHFDEMTKKGSILFVQSEKGMEVKKKYKLYFINEFYESEIL